MKASWIIDQLIQQGVAQFCIAPGSRSTPLVQAASTHPGATLHVHFDERGLGFFALGLSKATQKPTAIIATSGTAVGNLLPAVMEAHHAFTPLILLTADRPPELRNCGSNQTTDQTHLFQPFLRWQIDLPATANEAYYRSTMAQGYFYACQNPPGPIQINCPFAEPLYHPRLQASSHPIPLHFPRLRANPYTTRHSRGLILISRLPAPDDVLSVLELAERLHWPVCADILSNARCYPTVEQIKYFDFINKPAPTFVLHFGERLTSKKILEFLSIHKPHYVHVSPHPFLQDPARLLTERVQSDIPEFCQSFDAPIDLHWLTQWEDLEPQFPSTETFTEVHAMRALAAIVPSDYALFFGNGMPIRDADHFFFPKECAGFFGNRGLSGIDGNIATIAGLAQQTPVLGFIGDQAALHDLNSLALLKKTKYPVILLISNNYGGGIFHHLPVSADPQFETLWAAAHSLQFGFAARMFDIPYHPFSSLEELFEKKETAIVELITDRQANYHYQKKLTPTFTHI